MTLPFNANENTNSTKNDKDLDKESFNEFNFLIINKKGEIFRLFYALG